MYKVNVNRIVNFYPNPVTISSSAGDVASDSRASRLALRFAAFLALCLATIA